ncbi:MAG: hypothetical protein KVP17_003332 [Porospora cf. gigantea B]|uniref:uncharacterized protein n=1 Tax=Porospora cf. gigantea B TaxID=2853592 RepID=UPI003571959C|nr:MAG: hypothetical protein KVP17_003332 [Porospora cf. gigantea B]
MPRTAGPAPRQADVTARQQELARLLVAFHAYRESVGRPAPDVSCRLNSLLEADLQCLQLRRLYPEFVGRLEEGTASSAEADLLASDGIFSYLHSLMTDDSLPDEWPTNISHSNQVLNEALLAENAFDVLKHYNISTGQLPPRQVPSPGRITDDRKPRRRKKRLSKDLSHDSDLFIDLSDCYEPVSNAPAQIRLHREDAEIVFSSPTR